MRIWMIALVLAAGCKDKPTSAPSSGSGSGSAVPIVVDWPACDAALVKAATLPLDARPQAVLDGCQVCGDWKPLLAWRTPAGEGGPKREQVEAVMVACNAFCTGDSKLKFMNLLDKARGTVSRAPWRQLAKLCDDRVSAGADDRFMSAPYLALDRIARAAAARGGETAQHLAALELPLPPVTTSGEGPVLPEPAGEVSATVGALHVTVLGESISVGRLPRAKLFVHGVQLDLGPTPYPGEQVKLAELGAVLTKLVGDDKTQTITLLAPHAMPAKALVPVIAAASKVAPIYLGAKAHESPVDWLLVGAIPVALEPRGDKPIVVTPDMTVANLANELAQRAAQHQPRVGVTAK